MRILSSSFACVQQRRTSNHQPGVEAWARDLIADPARYSASQREAAIVADLLSKVLAR